MKSIMISLVGAALVLSMATACQTSSAPISISKIESSAAQSQTETAHIDEDAPRISLEDAKKAFDQGTAIFVDTRDANSYNSEHIKGAINVPAADLQAKINTIPTDKKIIAYCS